MQKKLSVVDFEMDEDVLIFASFLLQKKKKKPALEITGGQWLLSARIQHVNVRNLLLLLLKFKQTCKS